MPGSVLQLEEEGWAHESVSSAVYKKDGRRGGRGGRSDL